MTNPKTTTTYVVVNSDILERANSVEQSLIEHYLLDLARAMRKVECAKSEINAVLKKYTKANENIFM